MLANALAVAVRLRLFGDETMFHVGAFDYDLIHGIPFYLLLGVICGFAAVGFAGDLKRLEEFFDHMKKVPAVLHPAIGALGLGIVGYFFPRVFGPGYATICGCSERAVRADGGGVASGFQGRRRVAFARVGNLGRHAGADVHDQRGDWQHVRDGRELFRSRARIFRSGAYAVAAMGAFCAPARARHSHSWSARLRRHTIFMPSCRSSWFASIADAIAVRYMPNSIMTEKLARDGFRRGSGIRDEFAEAAQG